ncbi:MAG: DUF481 domain-containing protein [Acidiferrobacterales bacterium]|nr:DUF481 domain-containing protein [Acidiferrobacterales bacterium]
MRLRVTKILVATAAISAFSSAPAFAAWTGQGEAGLVTASGNTDSENANIGLAFINESEVWTHEIGFKLLQASADGEDTAQSIAADYLAKRDLSERSYLFGGLGYIDDEFDGFTEQLSASVGYGYRVIDTEAVGLEFGVGVGYRDTSELIQLDDGSELEGKDLSGPTGVLLMNYRNKFTATTEFVDSFRAEIGSDNTFVENEAALIVAMNEKFALKAGLLIRHNTDPAEGFDETDTITSINLVYNF